MMIPDEGHPATPCSDRTRDAAVASEVVEVPADIVQWRRGIRTSVYLCLLPKTHSFKTSLLTMIIAQHAGRQQDTHQPGAVLSSKHYANAWTGQSHRLRRRTTSTTICQDSRSIWRATRKNKQINSTRKETREFGLRFQDWLYKARLAVEGLLEGQSRGQPHWVLEPRITRCDHFDDRAASSRGVFAWTKRGLRSTSVEVWHGILYETGLRLLPLDQEQQDRKHPCITGWRLLGATRDTPGRCFTIIEL